MYRQQISRLVRRGAAFLAVALAAAVCGWAYYAADTPIVILDGSLTMQSAVPWNQFTGTGDLRSHPETTKSVTKVVITMPGKNQTVTFSNQQCTVDITYAGTDIKFTTGNNGKGLSVTPLSAFQKGSSPKQMAHKNQTAKISHVTVIKAGVKTFDSAASGGTQVTIHYQ